MIVLIANKSLQKKYSTKVLVMMESKVAQRVFYKVFLMQKSDAIKILRRSQIWNNFLICESPLVNTSGPKKKIVKRGRYHAERIFEL